MRTLKTVKSFDVSPDGRTLSTNVKSYQLNKIKSFLLNIREEVLLKNVEFIEVRGSLSTSNIYIKDYDKSELFIYRSSNGFYSSITIARVGRSVITKEYLSVYIYRLIESTLSYICKPCLSLVDISLIDYLRIDENDIIVGANDIKFIFSSNDGRLAESLRVSKSKVGTKQ